MAIENFGSVQSFKAAADYSDSQYCAVYVSAADTVTRTGAGGKVHGILLNKPDAAGKPAEVLTASGAICKLKVAANSTNIAVGDPLESDANGRGVKVTIDGDGTTETYMIGWALEAATADDVYISVLTNFAPISK